MLLRHKFGLLALLYASSILLTLVVAVFCIMVYFDSAFREAHSLLLRQDEVEHLRTLARAEFAIASAPAPVDEILPLMKELDAEFLEVVARLEPESSEGAHAALWQAVKDAYGPVHRCIRGVGEPAAQPAVVLENAAKPMAALDAALVAMRQALSETGNARVLGASTTQQRVVSLLVVNAVVAAVLCVLGLILVQRWVARPVGELRAAARRISEGDFATRIEARSHDELGRLGEEVNLMCTMITAMQARLSEQERLAGAGEMVSRLAHNIRNPLAGLRGLAEETLHRHPSDADTSECQRRIIETVDRFEKWLRELQQSVSPLTICPQRIDVRPWIDNVVAVAKPMALRRRVELSIETDPSVEEVVADPMHLEQALVALVTNAVQATPAGGRVTVGVHRVEDAPGGWELRVEDTGEGVAPELHEKVFQPYFTTKRDGHGLGLAMVERIVKLHGGRTGLKSAPGRGSRFSLYLPMMEGTPPLPPGPDRAETT